MKYEKEKIAGYRLVDRNYWGNAGLGIFVAQERDLVLIAGQIQAYQFGEASAPEGMDHEQMKNFMEAPKLKELAKRAGEWYTENGGKGLALALPFLVGEK